jgi:hypothetical protein
VWALIFQQSGLISQAGGGKSVTAVLKERQKGLNALIILVAREVWKLRNACVFDNARPSIQEVLRSVNAEEDLWYLAGASKLQMHRSLLSGA